MAEEAAPAASRAGEDQTWAPRETKMSLPKAINTNIHPADRPPRLRAGREHLSTQEPRGERSKGAKGLRSPGARSRPRWPGSAILGKPWLCPYCSRSLRFTFSRGSAPRFVSASQQSGSTLRLSPDKNPGARRLSAGINVVFLWPTTVGTSGAAIPPPPRHNGSIVPRVPPGPKPRRVPPTRSLRALDLVTGASHTIINNHK